MQMCVHRAAQNLTGWTDKQKMYFEQDLRVKLLRWGPDLAVVSFYIDSEPGHQSEVPINHAKTSITAPMATTKVIA